MDLFIYDEDSVINKWLYGNKGWRLDVADELRWIYKELEKSLKKMMLNLY